MRIKWYHLAALLFLLAVVAFLWNLSTGPEPSAPEVASGRPERERRRTAISHSRPSRPAKEFRVVAADASKGNLLTLSGNEIDAFLLSRHRSAESLLAAYQLSGDDAYLIEALQKFPQDPAVLLASLRLSGDPAENLKTLEALKLADPGNGLGHCLAARALFDLGRTDEALAELLRMSGKPLDDYMILSCQAVEEAYIAAGFSSLDAKITSLYSATKPSLMKMGSPLVKNLDAMRTAYEASGNQEGVDSIRRIQAEIGARLRSAGSLVDELVGILHEKAALRGLDSPDAADRLNEVEQRKTALTQASWKIPKLMENPAVPESDWVSYFDRVKLFGEKAANNWILERYPE